MSDKCLIGDDGFLKKTKDYLGEEVATQIYNELKESSLKGVVNDGKQSIDSLADATKKALTEQERRAKLEKYRAYLNRQASAGINKITSQYSNPLEGIQATLTGQYANMEEAISSSTELLQKAKIQQNLNYFTFKLESEGVYNDFFRKENSLEIAKVIYGDTTTASENIKKIGKIWRELSDSLRNNLNSLGADIGSLSEYIGANTHDPQKMLSASGSVIEDIAIRGKLYKKFKGNSKKVQEAYRGLCYQRWKSYILPRLDKSRTFTSAGVEEGSIDKFLMGSFDGLVSGIHLDNEIIEAIDFDNKPKMFKNFGDKIGAQRKIHFSDGTGWAEYADKYGSGSAQQNMANSIRRSSSNIAIMQRWGPNPRRMFDIKLKEAVEKASRTDFIKPDDISTTKGRMQAYFDMLDGTANIPVSQGGARTGQALRSWQFYSKLGGMFLSSLSDTPLRAETMRIHGKGVFQSYGMAIRDLFKGRPSGEQKQIAQALGVWASTKFGHMAAYMADSSNPLGAVSKMQMIYNKLTFQEWLDETNRLSMGSFLSKVLAQNMQKSFDNLDKSYRDILKMYGIKEKEWNLMRSSKNVYRTVKGEKFITPDSVNFYTDESIAEYLGIDVTELTDYKRSKVKTTIQDRLTQFFIDQTDDSTLQPGIQTKHVFLRGTKAGTWTGEVARFIGQFKYYPIEFSRRVLGRKISGIKEDRGYGLERGESDIKGLINVILGATMSGLMIMEAKNILKNRTPRSLTDPMTYIAALLQGGGLGLYGDFLFGQFNRFGSSIIESIAGPVPVSLEQAATIVFRMEHMEDPTNQMWQFAKNNTPYLNLFYLRPAMDFLMLNAIQENISPGSLQRYNETLKKQNDQQYIVSPTSLNDTISNIF